MNYTYQYPHMAVTVDAIVFLRGAPRAKVLLIKRGYPPFEDFWAIPGGYVDMNETILEAAHRELREETGAEDLALNFLGYFDMINRDPRERTLSFAFWSDGSDVKLNVDAADDASDAHWFSLDNLPVLAFDHQDILSKAISEFERS